MMFKILPTLSFVCVCLCPFPAHCSQHSFAQGRVEELVPIEDHIRQLGYPVEIHNIQTEDGYILTYHRIPYGKLHTTNSTRPPVLVQHGILAISRVWVEVNQSLGFALADAGYDVWLANARGNTYSRKHVFYDPDKDKERFWDFSWHEMGFYDLPAGIDYILNTTGYPQLSLVAHSMGTTMYFVLGATRPEYMLKIKVTVLMAPIAYLNNVVTPVFNVMHSLRDPLTGLAKLLGVHEFLRFRQMWYWLVHDVCAYNHAQFICLYIVGAICGFDNAQLEGVLLPSYLDGMPGGTSVKALIHYGQTIDNDFRQFDYGLVGNLKRYLSVSPPEYNLKNANAPLHLYLAANDWIVPVSTAVRTAQKMPNLQGLKIVNYAKFNHGDFMWAKDVKSLVYDDVIETIKKYL